MFIKKAGWLCSICLALLLSACQSPATAPSASPKEILDMSCKIEMAHESYDGPQQWTVEQIDDQTVLLTTDLGDSTTKTFTEEQIRKLNQLHRSITDYTNILYFEHPDTTFYYEDQAYTFSSVYTTQIELEQYIKMLFAYIDDVEYDMSVESREFEQSDNP